MSGLAVCRIMKTDPRTAALPILAVSAVADRGDTERIAIEAGAAAFLTDEADATTFLDAIRVLLERT